MASAHPQSNRAYFINIFWSWLSVAVLLVSGVVFVPILIRRLGDATYGTWTLAVSLVEYFWMIDLGLRAATIKFAAEFRALGQFDALNRLLNTALAYSVTAGSVLFAVAWFAADHVAALLKVTDPNFPFLIRAVGLSWAGGLAFNMFGALLEGFNRFDLSNRSALLATFLRAGLSVVLVLQGYGLREMGMVLVFSQFTGYLMIYLYSVRVMPQMRISTRSVTWGMARMLFGYSRQVIPGVVGGRMAQGILPSVIAYFTSTAQVTYFTQTQRLLEYVSAAVGRIGAVTTPRATDMHARGEREQIVTLARSANRYCLTLWGLFASYLFVFGADFCRLWVDREFGDQIAPLLPIFVLGYTCWMGQYISSSVLLGVARYTRYSAALLVEALLAIAAMAVLLPLYGLAMGVAAVAGLMAVTRCGFLSYLFCAQFEIPVAGFLAQIFGRPLLLIAASTGAMLAWRQYLGPADSWMRLIAPAALLSVLYSLLAFRFVLASEHRTWLRSRAGAAWIRFRARSSN
jgi:O-antigen/teichoic acid export membrane protein